MKSLTRCAKCPLKGKKKVYGSIGHKNDVLFMGEAPGKNEEFYEEVFCGRAGKLLTKGLKLIDMVRKDVTIINTLLCRPPDNRDPTILELKCCRKRVLHTIKKVDPKIIVLLGKVSFRCLFKRGPLHSDRFKRMYWRKRRVILIYHPAYFLYKKDEDLFRNNFEFIRYALGEESWDV